MYVYMYIYVNIYIHIYMIYVYIYIYMYINIYAYQGCSCVAHRDTCIYDVYIWIYSVGCWHIYMCTLRMMLPRDTQRHTKIPRSIAYKNTYTYACVKKCKTICSSRQIHSECCSCSCVCKCSCVSFNMLLYDHNYLHV